MTDRLYYDDAYLTEFEARVLECDAAQGGYAVRLDRSAFYPTSGGQPFDAGTLGGANILDVYVADDGEMWHVVDDFLPVGETVRGIIDWTRRFDHMQQHAGEHMLANAVYRLCGGNTIGLHLGAEVSTIDVTLPEGKSRISDEELRALEDDVNARIQRDVPIRCWFPDAEELKALPLRKPPAVNEHIRIVQIGELEFCACGGTHPASAGQVGLLKIVDARPSRGKLRLSFVCGKRAYALLRQYYEIASAVAGSLSTSVYDLQNLVCSMADQLKNAEKQLAEAKMRVLISEIPAMLSRARRSESGILVVAETVEADGAVARELSSKLAENGGVIAIIAAQSGDGYVYAACRSANVEAHMGALLSSAAKACGGKGGGRPDFAQGGGPKEMLARMAEEALARL